MQTVRQAVSQSFRETEGRTVKQTDRRSVRETVGGTDRRSVTHRDRQWEGQTGCHRCISAAGCQQTGQSGAS